MAMNLKMVILFLCVAKDVLFLMVFHIRRKKDAAVFGFYDIYNDTLIYQTGGLAEWQNRNYL